MKILRNRSGYSLIELIISVTIVSILTLTIGVFFVNATIAWTRNNTETLLQAENQRAIDAIKKDINSANALALINDNEITLYVPALNSSGSPLYSDANRAFTCKNTVQYQFDSGSLYRYVTANTASGCNAAAGNATSDSTTTIIQDDSTSDIMSGSKFTAATGTSSCSADIYACNNISVSFTRQKSQFGKTYTLTSNATVSLARVDPTYLEYYFYGTPTEPNGTSAWSSETLLSDGSVSTAALNSSTGSSTSNYLLVSDTAAPLSGGSILGVQVRMKAYQTCCASGPSVHARVYESGTSTDLGGVMSTAYNDQSFITDYSTLSAPSGGWTWAKVAALDARVYSTTTGSFATAFAYHIEIKVRVI